MVSAVSDGVWLHRLLRVSLRLRGVRSNRVTVSGLPIHFYEVEGPGRVPLVWVHGLGSSAGAFARSLFLLQPHFSRVVAFDFPGNGLSPMPPGGPLSIEAQKSLLHTFLSDVMREPVFLVGNSLGGGLALAVALDAPERVCALGLVAPAGAQLPEDKQSALAASLDVKTSAHARDIVRRLFHRVPAFAFLYSPWVKRAFGSASSRAVLAQAHTAAASLSPSALTRLSVPTLLLWGESEKVLPEESLAYFRAHLPPIARIETVQGFGHIPHVEHPHALASRLVAFVKEKANL
ncbi:MAG: alpha/beta fold hydrolase [Myxococcaceae bacterium]